jgi:hypothetical protein
MGYIKEPKGVDFIVAPTKLTEDDIFAIQSAISNYRRDEQVLSIDKTPKTNGKYARTAKLKSEQKAC